MLKLELCELLTDAGCSRLHKLPHLRELSLRGVKGITDRTLEFGVGSVDLKHLNLGMTGQLTDSALVSIANHHPCLELLDLSCNDKVVDSTHNFTIILL